MVKSDMIQKEINEGALMRNNYLFSNLKEMEINYILKHIKKEVKSDNKIAINVLVDLNTIYYDNILKCALSIINVDEYLKFFDLNNLRRFRRILIDNQTHIQFILFNLERLLILEQQHINYLFDDKSDNYNVIALLKDNELSTYEEPTQHKIEEHKNYIKQ